MIKEGAENSCKPVASGYCRVEALVSVDERGQMVLPKDLRDKAEIRPGDKLAVTAVEKGGKVCCLFMIKVAELNGLVTDMLGPMMQEIKK
ncbi:MAG: AbrB/MazE/SpoVT family DNA-binding domain-containing protein [Dehalococcoidales bacterium]|nr:AbrB/MazE/SpoVT family DNA-binding domain-containing protein [Dehalococcoidales bacterium]